MAERKYDLEGVSVFIATPKHGEFPGQTVISYLETVDALVRRGVPYRVWFQSGGSVESDRTLCADEFLRSEFTHLFWVDSDVSWRPDDFVKFLALSTAMECVCAAYPVKNDPLKFFLVAPGERTMNEHGCLPIHGTGLGFCVVQRKVISRLAGKAERLMMYGRDRPVAQIFRRDSIDGHFRGEDHAFFADVRSLGYEVWLDPDVELGHTGPKEFRGSVKEFLRPAT